MTAEVGNSKNTKKKKVKLCVNIINVGSVWSGKLQNNHRKHSVHTYKIILSALAEKQGGSSSDFDMVE